MIIHTDTNGFDKVVLDKNRELVLVDFFATWCGPCKMMAPIVGEMAETFYGKIKIGKCDTDANMELAQKYGIASIPCFKVFKNGEVVETYIGAMSQDDFEEKLEKGLA